MSPPPRLEALARAKLNLFLHVGAKRTDGYHALSSWVAFAALGDVIVAEACEAGVELSVDGPFAADTPTGPDNLIRRAAGALIARAGMPSHGARLWLTKRLPVASGIGGGSADAAATLHLLNEVWQLGIDGETLMEIGLDLGSDVPACVYNRSALMVGRGETIRPGPALPPLSVLVVNPGIAVKTAEVFARLSTRTGLGPVPLPSEIRDAAHLAAVLANTANDLDAPAVALAPPIRDVLAALSAAPGALFARVSGSGATCFAVMTDEVEAQGAAIALKRARPDWWVAATRLDC